MRKRRKILRIILLAALILIIALVIFINFFADRALRIGIKTAATKALGVKVHIDDVALSIISGKLGIENLLIDNPKGYQHDKLLELKDAKVEVTVKSLLGKVVNIREITLDGASVVLEQRGVSGNNLQDVIKGISARRKSNDKNRTAGKKLHIDSLKITNTKLKVKLLPVPGKADTLTLKLAPIEMRNLGRDNKLNTCMLSIKVMSAIALGIVEQTADLLPKEMIGSLLSELSELKKLGILPEILLDGGGKILKIGTDVGKKAIETGMDVGKKAIETGKDVGEAATDVLKGIVKPKKKEE